MGRGGRKKNKKERYLYNRVGSKWESDLLVVLDFFKNGGLHFDSFKIENCLFIV